MKDEDKKPKSLPVAAGGNHNGDFAMTKTENKTIRQLYTFDNLPVLRRMDSETVDLIYLDPPFNSGKQWENPVQAGGKKALASFKDTWTLSDIHVDEAWALGRRHSGAIRLINLLGKINGDGWKAYLIYMGVRLAEMRRILKPGGSIFYHCDPVMSHGVKLLMDSIFGKRNFQNEIVWCYQGRELSKARYNNKHDVVLFYSKGNPVFNWEAVGNELSEESRRAMSRHQDEQGRWFVVRYKKGGGFAPLEKEGDGSTYRQYVPEKIPPRDWFIMDYERKKKRSGYPTQKPRALLERIIAASSNPGDVVLDPFCGCATTCVAAERLGRQWIGIDLSEEAKDIVLDRLKKETELPLTNPENVVEHLTKIPQRTDLKKRTDNAELKPDLYADQRERCAAPCGDELDEKGRRLGRKVEIDFMDFDHIIATARGGTNTDNNLQLLCRTCNALKNSGGMERLRRLIFRKKEQESMDADRKKWEEEAPDEEE